MLKRLGFSNLDFRMLDNAVCCRNVLMLCMRCYDGAISARLRVHMKCVGEADLCNDCQR